jgi:hypothetical protein
MAIDKRRGHRLRGGLLASASLAAVVVAAPAGAMEIDLGNRDLSLRWDNTVRYSVGMRMENVNHDFANHLGNDETETAFDRYDVMLNRVDLLSELDFAYQRKYGFRLSGAGWRDFAYDNDSHVNPNLVGSGNYYGNTYNDYTKDYIVGPHAEVLDAFVFGNFQVSGTLLRAKAGRHNLYWGESLYTLGNSIAYSQGPVDTIKAATSPGAEAKELFMPLNQVSAQWQVTREVAIAGQYLLEWDSFRNVPGGTYFSVGSSADGSRSDYGSPPGAFPIINGLDIEPEEDSHDWGLSVRWSPKWLGGTLGFYYRNFDEKVPWSITALNGALPSQVQLVYGQDTELYGASLATNYASVSIGAELSYRRNTALVGPNGRFVSQVPGGSALTYDQAEGARGKTLHALVNGVWLMPETSLWTGGTLQGEISGQHLVGVTKNRQAFLLEDTATCGQPNGIKYGCATKNSVGVQGQFRPEWPQALPGIDLAMPVSGNYQIYGNGAALVGGNEGSYGWSIGLDATYKKRYDFSLKYSDKYSSYQAANGLYLGGNGSGAVQNNHGWLSASFKTTF